MIETMPQGRVSDLAFGLETSPEQDVIMARMKQNDGDLGIKT
jgi:hypothetical protein